MNYEPMDPNSLLYAIGLFAVVCAVGMIVAFWKLAGSRKQVAERERANTALIKSKAAIEAKLTAANDFGAQLIRELVPLKLAAEERSRKNSKAAKIGAAKRAAARLLMVKSNGGLSATH